MQCSAGYFVQGVKTNLAVLAEQYMLKDRFSFQPDKVGICAGLCKIAGVVSGAGLTTLFSMQVELWHQIAHTPWVRPCNCYLFCMV